MYSDEFLVALIEGANYVQSVGIVNKDECKYSCESPFTKPDGLFVSLTTGVGVGRTFLTSREAVELFLQFKFEKVLIEADVDASRQEIVGAKTEIRKRYFVRVMVDNTLLEEGVEYPFETVEIAELVPENVLSEVERIVKAPSMESQEAVVAYSAMQEKPEISRFSFDLVQESAQQTVNIYTELCQYTKQRCANLWLNLSDGFIGGGRKQTGDVSGENMVSGTDGARLHYEECRREKKEYPLVVKLGTITATTAEVYSYAEDDMVEDACIDAHLKHWGIDRSRLEKTSKSLAEMEYEMNKDFAFDKILGHEKDAEVISDLVGLRNLGNTCYINALLQLVARIPEFKMFASSTAPVRTALDSATLQWCKIVDGIVNAKYADSNISPFTFRELFCSQHVDFKTHQQQDCVDFYQFIVERFPSALNKLFEFSLATDLVVDRTHGKRDIVTECFLSLQVPYTDPQSLPKRPKLDTPTVSFDECVAKTFGETEISDFRYKGQIVAEAFTRLSFVTFPKYLFVAVRRYFFDEAWQPQKMDVAVSMPTQLDLAHLRASDSQNLVPLDDQDQDALSPEVASLVEMGFAAELAAKALKKTAGSVEAAMDLLFSGALEVQVQVPKTNVLDSGKCGSSKYRLVGFVSHLGKSVGTGHYVAHWWRREQDGGSWVLFNDEKVTKCSTPPLDYGYLYLYEQE